MDAYAESDPRPDARGARKRDRIRIRSSEPRQSQSSQSVLDLAEGRAPGVGHDRPGAAAVHVEPSVDGFSATHFVTADAKVHKLLLEAMQIARTDLSVVLCGETGTGKELLARIIHQESVRHTGPFVAVNSAGLPRDLIEAELFGVERGAATGVEARPGKFEQAHGGTLLLDEIGDMPSSIQAALLRALEEQAVYRVGASVPRPASVRVIAATNANVNELLHGGQFRHDLYYRLAAWVGTLPPLRERAEDICVLARHFLEIAAAGDDVRAPAIEPAAMATLLSFDWPGNVRQLRNEMLRAYALTPAGEAIAPSRFSPEIRVNGSAAAGTLKQRLEACEKEIIASQIRRCAGDPRRTAASLSISLSTLYRRLRSLGLLERSSSPRERPDER